MNTTDLMTQIRIHQNYAYGGSTQVDVGFGLGKCNYCLEQCVPTHGDYSGGHTDDCPWYTPQPPPHDDHSDCPYQTPQHHSSDAEVGQGGGKE